MELNQVLLRATAHITAAYALNHSITGDELAEVIEVVGKALTEATEPATDKPGSRRSVKPRRVAVAPQNMQRGFPAQVDVATNGSQRGAGSQDETTRVLQATERPAAPGGIRRRRNEQPIVVTDDWPGMIPVTEQEVRIVEAFLGDKLDEIFGAAPPVSVDVPPISEKMVPPGQSKSVPERHLKSETSSKPKASKSKPPRRSPEDKLTLVAGGPPLTGKDAVEAEARVDDVVMQLARLLGRQLAREIAKEQTGSGPLDEG